jgi:hypothetical protein
MKYDFNGLLQGGEASVSIDNLVGVDLLEFEASIFAQSES